GRFAWLATLPARTRLKAARRAGRYLKVLQHGEEVLARDPWNLATQLEMAAAAEALGMLNLAVWILEEARDRAARDVPLNRALARLYEKRGNLAEAIAQWDLVRQADPSDIEAAEKVTNLAASDTIARIRSEDQAS